MALQGHSPTQAPHSMHSASLITARPFSMVIALTGQAATQVSQPPQTELSTFAAILISPVVSLGFDFQILLQGPPIL